MDLRTSRVFLTIFGQCINVLNYNIVYSLKASVLNQQTQAHTVRIVSFDNEIAKRKGLHGNSTDKLLVQETSQEQFRNKNVLPYLRCISFIVCIVISAM